MNTRLRVKYSYYAILILDTVQPIVNTVITSESCRKSQKVMEVTTSSYVILEWSGAFIMAVVCGLS